LLIGWRWVELRIPRPAYPISWGPKHAGSRDDTAWGDTRALGMTAHGERTGSRDDSASAARPCSGAEVTNVRAQHPPVRPRTSHAIKPANAVSSRQSARFRRGPRGQVFVRGVTVSERRDLQLLIGWRWVELRIPRPAYPISWGPRHAGSRDDTSWGNARALGMTAHGERTGSRDDSASAARPCSGAEVTSILAQHPPVRPRTSHALKPANAVSSRQSARCRAGSPRTGLRPWGDRQRTEGSAVAYRPALGGTADPSARLPHFMGNLGETWGQTGRFLKAACGPTLNY